jgi:hypothetical protein
MPRTPRPTQKEGNITKPVREGIDIRPDRSGDGATVTPKPPKKS